MIEFANNLRSLRISRHMSQKELAERLSLTSSVISAYENNIRLPSYDTLLQIASIFGCSCDYLLGRDNSMKSSRKLIDVTDLTDKQYVALQSIIEAFRND